MINLRKTATFAATTGILLSPLGAATIVHAAPQPGAVAVASVQAGVSSEYRNALSQAKTYATRLYMSKAAVYDQLVSKYGGGFSKGAASYAVKNVKANWKANAVKQGTSYARNLHLSKQGVYDQLVSKYGGKFTKDEAGYARRHVKANWNANALYQAKFYSSKMHMSPSQIRGQLTSQYGGKFTASEAAYAVRNL